MRSIYRRANNERRRMFGWKDGTVSTERASKVLQNVCVCVCTVMREL